MRINHQINDLEIKMRKQWNELKESLTPAGIIQDAYSSIIKNIGVKNSNGESILKSTITFGMALLLGKFAQKAVTKFSGGIKNNM
jgi:hypothetical protein